MQIEEEFIIKTRQHFANIQLACIEDAKSGKEKVNDFDTYIEWCMTMHNRSLAGDYDHTFAHRHYAHYLQTGVMIPLLP
jgi:hypothetical protein